MAQNPAQLMRQKSRWLPVDGETDGRLTGKAWIAGAGKRP